MIIRGFRLIGLRHGLGELDQYLKITEQYLKQAKLEYESWLDEQAKELDSDEADEFISMFSEEYYLYKESFPRILRNSFLVSTFSVFEWELRNICKWVKKSKAIPINWSDLRGDTLKKLDNYFKLANIPLPTNNPTWRELNNYQMVRNCIVHNKGLIKGFSGEKHLKEYATKKGIILIGTPELEIALTEDFCKEVLANLRKFIGILDNLFHANKDN